MHDHDPQPWQCDECGHVNSPESPVCRCYFWPDAPPAWFFMCPACDYSPLPHNHKCPDCGRINDHHEHEDEMPATDLSQWLTVSTQEGAE